MEVVHVYGCLGEWFLYWRCCQALDLVTVEQGWSDGVGVDSLVPEGKQIGILVVVELSRVIVFAVTGCQDIADSSRGIHSSCGGS